MSDFEKDLLYFASPRPFLGRKQANLFSFSINCLTDYRKEIDRYKKELAPLGISVEYLYCKKQRVYLLVYRKDMMLHYFKQPAVKEFLIKQGYPETPDEEASLYETLCILRKRIIQGAEFPHEIGFFFGYPAEDVFAFIREKGHNYKLVGDWKVYGDGKAALHTFRSYARCRKRLMEQASAGADIVSLLTPARNRRSDIKKTQLHLKNYIIRRQRIMKKQLSIGAAQATQQQWPVQSPQVWAKAQSCTP